MARPKSTASVDLDAAQNLTVGLIERLTCPEGKQQAFVRDLQGNGLRVRVTEAGAKSFVFEAKLNRQTIRRTIGTCGALTIEEARREARRLQATLDKGDDPRELDRQKAEARASAEAQRRVQEQRESVTGLQAWLEYTAEGREVGFTSRGPWSARHIADHEEMVDPGGRPFKRGKGTTAPGPLYELLSGPLGKLDTVAVETWLRRESQRRPARAALGFRLLRGFLNWCGEHPVYRQIAAPEAHVPKRVRRLVRKQERKLSALQREQLRAWFSAVQSDRNPVASAYLQALLLTGARKGEIAGLGPHDVNLTRDHQGNVYGSLKIRDKVEGEREIPCPPYLAQLLSPLLDGARGSDLVFGNQKIAHNAAYNLRRAHSAAGLPQLSMQGLRRSFKSLAEWLEIPAGVVAQIMGHKPSATAERHYTVRPLDILRLHHTRIENWMLEQAGIQHSRSMTN